MHRSLLVAVAVVAAATVAAASAVFLPRAHEQTARPELQHIIDNLVTGPDRIAPGAVAYVSGPKGTWVGIDGPAG